MNTQKQLQTNKFDTYGKQYLLWTLKIGDGPEREIIIELDTLLCPKTCQNFYQICLNQSNLTYKNTIIHRIVEDGYLEGGIYFEGSSQQGSIYGEYFPDENYAFGHSQPGTIGMSKYGPHRNGCAFYITLRPLEHLNRRNVSFGKVIQGMNLIQEIGRLETINQRPIQQVVVTKIERFMSDQDSGSRPTSVKTEMESKLEQAALDTLLKRRQDILKEIDDTRNELNGQRLLKNVIIELLEEAN